MKEVIRNSYDGDKIVKQRILTFKPYSYDEIDTVIERLQDYLSSDFFLNHLSMASYISFICRSSAFSMSLSV